MIDYSKLTPGQIANLLEGTDIAPVIYVYTQVNPTALNDAIKTAAPSFFAAYEDKLRMMTGSEKAAFIKNNILCGNIPIAALPAIQFEDADCDCAVAVALHNNRKKFEKNLLP